MSFGATKNGAMLLEAVNDRKVLAIRYDGIARGKQTEREIEPIGLVRYANVWLVPAYCRLRHDLRVFRWQSRPCAPPSGFPLLRLGNELFHKSVACPRNP